MIRPQMKRQKEHSKMVSGLNKGDEVVTSGGLLGKITDVGDNFVEKMQVAVIVRDGFVQAIEQG